MDSNVRNDENGDGKVAMKIYAEHKHAASKYSIVDSNSRNEENEDGEVEIKIYNESDPHGVEHGFVGNIYENVSNTNNVLEETTVDRSMSLMEEGTEAKETANNEISDEVEKNDQIILHDEAGFINNDPIYDCFAIDEAPNMAYDGMHESSSKDDDVIYDCFGFIEEQCDTTTNSANALKQGYEHLQKGPDDHQYTLLTIPNMEAILNEMSAAEDAVVNIVEDESGQDGDDEGID